MNAPAKGQGPPRPSRDRARDEVSFWVTYLAMLSLLGVPAYYLGPGLARLIGPLGYTVGALLAIAAGLWMDWSYVRTTMLRLRINTGPSSAVWIEALPLYLAGVARLDMPVLGRFALLCVLWAAHWLSRRYVKREALWRNGTTPLHWAARDGNLDDVKRALEGAPNPLVRDNIGRTPFHFAQRDRPKFGVLRDYSAQYVGSPEAAADRAAHAVDVRDRLTAESIAAVRTVGRLLRDERDEPQLHVWVLGGEAFTVAVKPWSSADANEADGDGWRALHEAVYVRHEGIVQMLLGRSADVDAADNGGWTPLHLAAFLGYDNLAAALLRGGARSDLTDSQGRTPLRLATEQGHATTVRLLEQHEARRGRQTVRRL